MILYQDQPDYGALAEAFDPPFLPKLIRDMWTHGDHLERRYVDRLLETQRRSLERDQREIFRFD
jgi:hypothetical protein